MQSGSVSGHWSGADTKPNAEEVVNLSLLNAFDYTIWKSGFRGSIQKFQTPMRYLIDTSVFSAFMILCVVMNTIVLAINYYGIDPETNLILDDFNLAFTILFTIEMVMKIWGLGVLGYFRVKQNVFDCIVVILSLLEISLLSNSGMSALRSIRVFRAFRVLRVARLFRYMRYMQRIVGAISKAIQNFLYMGLLLALFTVVFTLMGMQLFGGEFNFSDGKPRSNYDNFYWSFLTTFQLLTMENWHNVLYNGMRTYLGDYACIYFIVWIFFGNYILLNLFLAILLDSFENLDSDEDIDNEELMLLDTEKQALNKQKTALNFSRRKQKKIDQILKQIEAIKEEESMESGSVSVDALFRSKQMKPLFVGNYCQRSFSVFPKSSPIRAFCYRITNSSKFETCILLLIAVSTLKLIWETYLLDEPAGSMKLEVSTDLDIILTVLFTIEFLLKSTSLGFILGKGTYLRDCWNISTSLSSLFHSLT